MKIGVANNKQKYFWNMIGSICNSLLSVLLLLAINRIVGSESGGIFSFAYANAQLLVVIGGFEVRTLQATDIENEYSFKTYFTFRVITCVLMIIICILYAYISKFDTYKVTTIIIFCVYKAVEAFADVFAGVYQQKDRIDLCGKTFALRTVLSGVGFIIALCLTHNMNMAGITMIVVSLILLICYDIPIFHCFDGVSIGISFNKIKKLFWEAVPLFVSAFIMMYINNAPKYAINDYCSDIEQNLYGILFMPAFVINLFSVFIFRPVLVNMKMKWNDYEMRTVKRYIFRSIFSILAMTIICVVVGTWIGLPILSFLYGVDLFDSKIIFIIIMIYGGFNAYGNYFYYVLTVMREQKKILIAYLLAFIVILFLAPVMVRNYSLIGAALSSLITFVVLDAVLGCIIIKAMLKHKKECIVRGEKE